MLPAPVKEMTEEQPSTALTARPGEAFAVRALALPATPSKPPPESNRHHLFRVPGSLAFTTASKLHLSSEYQIVIQCCYLHNQTKRFCMCIFYSVAFREDRRDERNKAQTQGNKRVL